MLKPTDIQNKEFEIKMRGYDRDEVDDFLDEIIKDMTTLYTDNTELSKRLNEATDLIAKLQAKEGEIKQSLELARYQCEEMKKNAQAEAKQIVENARLNALSASKDMDDSKVRLKALCQDMLDKLNSF